MRGRCGALIAAAALAAVASPAAAAPPGPRAALLFLPGPVLVQPGLSLGLTSPTLGGYKRPQFAIDLSQGARISTRAYTRALPPLALQVGGGRGQVAGWDRVLRRARAAPGDVVPGLLASTIERAGGSVAYAGVSGAEDTESFAAADEGGRIGRVSVGPAAGFGARAAALWRSSSLLVARLPSAAALPDLMRARRPGDLVVVVQAPPVKPLTLLYSGAVGPGISGHGVIRSATTRRDGYIAAPDVSATVLRALGLKVPNKMQGERIESRSAHDARYVRDLKARLDAILPHRDRAVEVIALVWAAAALLLWLIRRRAGLRAMGRMVFLGALWLPALALFTAAIQPSELAEALILAFGALALAALTDALLPWPAAPLVPAAVTFGTHAIDLALGSHLIGLSLAGPNPKGGSRFFGIGNELEIILAITVLVGTGAALTLMPERAAPRAFALAAFVAAVVVGAGRLGADVGGVITLGAGGAAAVVASLNRGPTPRAVALAIVVPILAVGALVLLDLAIGGGAHLTHTLSRSSGPGDLGKVLLRRWRLSTAGLTRGMTPVAIGVFVALLVLGVVRRRQLLAPLSGQRERPFRAAVIGSFFAVVIGALANDSGPMIVMIGTVALVLLVGYVRSDNFHNARPPAGLPSAGCA
ncbi:MAG TPA: hypothetical protein VF032_11230 [Thermoleophilaceae bacterium]